jgi:tetratricopeptide (TPR) repeat protein
MDRLRQHRNQSARRTRRVRAAASGRVLAIRLLVGLLLLVGAGLAGRQVVRHLKDGSTSEEALAANDRGVASFKKGEVDKAIADFTEAIRLNPKVVSAYVNRALAANTKGQLERALADCDAAIQLDPKLAVAYSVRGVAWERKDEHDKAIADCDQAIHLDPKLENAFVARAAAWLNKGELDKSLADCDQVIRLDANDPMAYVTRGRVWFNKGALDKVLADDNEAIRLNPRLARAFSDRGLAWLQRGELDKALADEEQAIRLDPDAIALSNRGLVWERKAQYGKAVADYSEAVRLNPTFVTALINRAWIHATCADSHYRDGKAAVLDGTKACELTGWKNPRYLTTLAAAYAEAGDFASAVKSEEKAIELSREKSKGKLGPPLELYKARKPYRSSRSAYRDLDPHLHQVRTRTMQAQSDDLSNAIILFLGFGTKAWPHRDRARLVQEFGAAQAAALESRVLSIAGELAQIPVDWSVHSLQSGGEMAQIEMRARHPDLSETALRALDRSSPSNTRPCPLPSNAEADLLP